MAVVRVQGSAIAWKHWVETGEGVDVCLTQYLVGPDLASAPFTSIQSAYNAAKLAGAGPSSPAQILVCPGTYTENVTMDTPGIDVIAVAQDNQAKVGVGTPSAGVGHTVLAGLLTVNIDDGGAPSDTLITARWQGIDIRPASGTAVLFTGTSRVYCYLADCQIVSNNAAAIVIDNTGGEGTGSVLDVQHCSVDATGEVQDAVTMVGAELEGWPVLLAYDSQFHAGARVLIGDYCEALMDSCNLLADNLQVIEIGTSGLVELTCCNILTGGGAGGPDPVITVGSGSAAIVKDGVVDNAGVLPLLANGSGIFLHSDLTFEGNVLTIAQETSVRQYEALPYEQAGQKIDVTDTTYVLSTEVNVLPYAAAESSGFVTLPLVLERAGPIRLKTAEDNAGTVTVNCLGADTIRLDGAAPVASFTLDADGVFLVANPTDGYWEGWRFGGGAGAADCLNTFLVSPVVGAAPYTTIQGAYDAAKAAGFGYGGLGPAKVLVCPGSYVENVTMDTPGIDVVAVVVDKADKVREYGFSGATELVGSLTVTLDPTLPGPLPSVYLNKASWQGIDINYTLLGGAGLTFVNADYAQYFWVSDCRIAGIAEANTLIVGNAPQAFPGGSAPDPLIATPSTLELTRVGVEHFEIPNGGAGTAIDWGAGNLALQDCYIDGGGDWSIDQSGGEVHVDQSRILYDWRISAGFSFVLESYLHNIEVTIGGVLAAFSLHGLNNVTGDGTFYYDTISGQGVAFTWNPLTTVVIAQSPSLPEGQFWRNVTAGVYQISTEVNLIANTTVNPGKTLELPPALSRTGPIRVKEFPDGTGVDFIRAFAGETINGTIAPPARLAIPAGGVTLISDGTSNWETIN